MPNDSTGTIADNRRHYGGATTPPYIVLLRGTIVFRTKCSQEKSRKVIGFCVYRRSYLICPPVILLCSPSSTYSSSGIAAENRASVVKTPPVESTPAKGNGRAQVSLRAHHHTQQPQPPPPPCSTRRKAKNASSLTPYRQRSYNVQVACMTFDVAMACTTSGVKSRPACFLSP